MAVCACTSLIFTFFTNVPSLVCVEPKYLNWSTSSSIYPFICMLLDGLGLMLLTRILLLHELISMLYSAADTPLTTVGCQFLLRHQLQTFVMKRFFFFVRLPSICFSSAEFSGIKCGMIPHRYSAFSSSSSSFIVRFPRQIPHRQAMDVDGAIAAHSHKNQRRHLSEYPQRRLGVTGISRFS